MPLKPELPARAPVPNGRLICQPQTENSRPVQPCGNRQGRPGNACVLRGRPRLSPWRTWERSWRWAEHEGAGTLAGTPAQPPGRRASGRRSGHATVSEQRGKCYPAHPLAVPILCSAPPLALSAAQVCEFLLALEASGRKTSSWPAQRAGGGQVVLHTGPEDQLGEWRKQTSVRPEDLWAA